MHTKKFLNPKFTSLPITGMFKEKAVAVKGQNIPTRHCIYV